MSKKILVSPKKLLHASRQALARRHPFVVPVITFVLLVVFSLFAYVVLGAKTVGPKDVYVVNVFNAGDNRVVPTRAKTVGELLERLNINLAEKDKVEPSTDTLITENGFNVNIYRARYVRITDKDKKKTTELLSAEPTPRLLAKEAGIKVFPEDIVELQQLDFVSPEEALYEGLIEEAIIVERATLVQLSLFGENFEVRTHAKNVGELLEERQISVESVSVFPAVSKKLEKDQVVFITDPNKQIELVEEEIPSPIEFVDDFDILLGRTEVREVGASGKRVVIYEIAQDGSRVVLQEVVVNRPVTQLVARGRKPPVVAGNKAEIMAAAGISASEFYAVDFIISHESGWRVNAMSHNGCGGLGQACPASKLANVCPSWETDPVCQMQFFNGYAVGRYGSWTRAFEIWQLQRWW